MNPSSDNSLLLQKLRSGTASAHTSVEKNSGVDAILDNSITDKEYHTLLIKNFKAYFEIEQKLAQFLNHVELQELSFEPKISSWIRNDISQEPKYTFSTTSLANLYEGVGAIYVMEGSLLGGALIANHLLKCPNIVNLDSLSFHTRDERQSRSDRWKKFKTNITARNYPSEKHHKIIEGALKAFAIFEFHYQSDVA